MKKEAKKAAKDNVEFDFRTINSFEAACKKENLDPNALPDVSMIPEEFRRALVGVYKLFIIFKAINNGWIADYTDPNQNKFYPWLSVLSSGFGFSASYYACDGTDANVGSRLCTYSSETAFYIGEKFGVLGEEYKDFFLNRPQ